MKKVLPNQVLATTIPEIRREKFPDDFFLGQRIILIGLAISLLIGFSLRIQNLGTESLSEDELNKLQTVAEYREKGLTGRNGEHPFLMKGLQTLSVIIFEKVNQSLSPGSGFSDEFVLRFPTAVFGSLTILLLYFLVKKLFGSHLGLIASALWAVDPNSVGFDRIAKEDSFLLFFFLLANCFWLTAQSRAERDERGWENYVRLAAIAFGMMTASKYFPVPLGISAAYYNIFQTIPETKWRLGKYRWAMFFVLMGIAFVICNPPILLPDTWQHMMAFSSENRIGHDSYEFMGELYQNKMSLWLSGVPWTFYYVFIIVKTPILTLIFGLLGIVLIFRRRFGDGRFFVFFWIIIWFVPFSFVGGKFVRYFTLAQPVILILSAIGCFSISRFAAGFLSRSTKTGRHLVWIFPVTMIGCSLLSSLSSAPYFRLYTNPIGGGERRSGFYFPHDEFYDSATAEIVAAVAAKSRTNALVANETPQLFEYYFAKAGRTDLNSVMLSDKTSVARLSAGDFIVAAKGRRYFSNNKYLGYLENSSIPFVEVMIRNVSAARIYQLDEVSAAQIQGLADLP